MRVCASVYIELGGLTIVCFRKVNGIPSKDFEILFEESLPFTITLLLFFIGLLLFYFGIDANQ